MTINPIEQFRDAIQSAGLIPPDLIEPCIKAGCPIGGTVLDPFGGSGTTAGVALRNGRNAILCELNPEYAALMPERIAALGGNQPDLFKRAEK